MMKENGELRARIRISTYLLATNVFLFSHGKVCNDIDCSFIRGAQQTLLEQTIALLCISQFNNLFRFIRLNLCIGMIFVWPVKGPSEGLKFECRGKHKLGLNVLKDSRCYLRLTIISVKTSAIQLPDRSAAVCLIHSNNTLFQS